MAVPTSRFWRGKTGRSNAKPVIRWIKGLSLEGCHRHFEKPLGVQGIAVNCRSAVSVPDKEVARRESRHGGARWLTRRDSAAHLAVGDFRCACFVARRPHQQDSRRR